MIAQLLGSLGSTVVWFGAIAVVLVAVAFAFVGARNQSARFGLGAIIPVALGGFAAAVNLDVPAPDPAFLSVLGISLAALGVIGGYPITVWVLSRAETSDASEDGDHGGIVVEGESPKSPKREVLRGGWLIGYLERFAVIAAIVLGHWEIVAAVIAVKGLGRFSELDNAVARERFIIGTLTSLIWAGSCALLIVLSRGA
jgi:hypothetical protein